MALGLNEFKKRFGKKPVDPIDPETRFKARLAEVRPKFKGGLDRKEKPALDAKAELDLLIAKKSWAAAVDLLDEVTPGLDVDKGRADKLRNDVAVQVARVSDDGKLPAPLDGAESSLATAIKIDDYDDADAQLADFKDLVDDHLAKVALSAQRVKELETKGPKVVFRLRSSGSPTADVDANSFASKTTLFTSAVGRQNFATTEQDWGYLKGVMDAQLGAPGDGSPGTLKKAYETRRGAADLTGYVALAGKADKDFASVQPSLAKLKGLVDEADKLFGEARYAEALDSLDLAGIAVPGIKVELKALYDQLTGTIKAFAGTIGSALQKNVLPDSVKDTIDIKALKTANSQRFSAATTGDYTKAIQLFHVIEPDYQTIWRAMSATQPVAPIVAPTVTPASKAPLYQQLITGRDRDALTAALNAPDADLKTFREQPGAATLLDDMVGAMGGKADTPAKRDFVAAAMKARFGLKSVTGGADGKGLSTKALPRMYKLFAMLPPEHTTENENILSVERTKESDTSVMYASTKRLVLKAGTTDKIGGRLGELVGQNFDETTLHEIAHGVDMKFGFMAANGKARKFGGWQTETLESVKGIASDGLEFYSHFEAKGVLRPLLETYLGLVFAGSQPKTLKDQFKALNGPTPVTAKELKEHPAIVHAAAGAKAAEVDSDLQRDLSIAARKLIKDKEPKKSMLGTLAEKVAFGTAPDTAISDLLAKLTIAGASPADAVWDEMAVHPAIDFATNVGLKNGSSGLWDQGDSGAKRCSFNGRVYQEAYAGDWVSYMIGARATKVCDYQFRHRMEWFAECYSRFFLDRLSASHPLAGWLRDQKNAAAKPN